jgi:hypothetical protein
MLRRVALIAAPAGGVTPFAGGGGGAPPPPPAALVSPPPPLPQLPQADVKVEVRQYLYLCTSNMQVLLYQKVRLYALPKADVKGSERSMVS